MKLKNQTLSGVRTGILDDFEYILWSLQKLPETLHDYEHGIIQHTYFDKATAPSIEADIKLLIPELENVSQKLQDALSAVDEFTENLNNYIGE
ncbi:MAG: hypothetical protein MJZ34_02315 [Paludibacteraceae bacterium]|nr:hypothetical protein [Paludibacteraceae bacterium]